MADFKKRRKKKQRSDSKQSFTIADIIGEDTVNKLRNNFKPVK